jgi:hypothetical protein
MVDLERGESFGFLGFDFRSSASLRDAPALPTCSQLQHQEKEIYRSIISLMHVSDIQEAGIA